ncbi:hypothetical protein BCV70DRAFT_71405 [Testicularia cyperi]|uniref:mRNA cap guanine-N(7) methyltransferase n=1 Tax=Testicularia cyperi TaxID=1882483 RepID=A0A317XU07_9BASI|nr:hypothetical protein BCV70DRAFT_71405 [Testicularia cyperi]
MPGYDPVRDAGKVPEASASPISYHHDEYRRRPSYPLEHESDYPDAAAALHPPRSTSGQSLVSDRFDDGVAHPMSRHASASGSIHMSMSPRSSSSGHPRDRHRYPPEEVHSSNAHYRGVSPSQHAPSRSASIADLVTASEMTEAERERAHYHHNHRDSYPYAEDVQHSHSMSRSSSASASFNERPTVLHASTSAAGQQERFSPRMPRQIPRTERSPSMANLLNEGTAGAIQDRPRSGSHSSISSHISQQHPQHSHQQRHLSQQHPHQSPLGYSSSGGHPAMQAPPSSGSHGHASVSQSQLADRRPSSSQSRPGSATAGPSPWAGSPDATGMHNGPAGFSHLNRAGSSPTASTVPLGYGAGDRPRHMSQSGLGNLGALPRSGSTSFGYGSAASSPASAAHLHLQPSPSHRFAVPDIPATRSPEFRRAPLPLSPTAVHTGPSRNWSHAHGPSSGAPHTSHPDEFERMPGGGAMLPPTGASPRRASMAQGPPTAQRYYPGTSGVGIPPTPGSAASAGPYPNTPGSRSVPAPTPQSYGQNARMEQEANYFPQVPDEADERYDRPTHRASRSSSSHATDVDPLHRREFSSEAARAQVYRSNALVSTPGAAEPYLADSVRRVPEAPLPGNPQLIASPLSENSRRYSGQEQSATLSSPRSSSAKTLKRLQTPEDLESGPCPDVGNGARRADNIAHEIGQDQMQTSKRGLKEDDLRSQSVGRFESADDGEEEPAQNAALDAGLALVQRDRNPDADESIDVRKGPESNSSGLAKTVARPSPSTGTVSKADSEVEMAEHGHIVDEDQSKTASFQPLPRYAPTRRVSPPKQVMKPIGIEEIDHKRNRCRNPLRREWEAQYGADSREPLDQILRDFHSKLAAPVSASTGSTGDGNADAKDSARKRMLQSTLEDAEEVASHYNKRREVGIHGREESPIIGLRKFNNWIKSVLVGSFARGRDPNMDGRGRPRGGRILDLGCGKGGDLKKWDKVSPSGLVAADIAAVSIEQAAERHRDNGNKFPADFYAFDCFSTPLDEVIPRQLLEPGFDNVTLQFCMHYAWEDVQKARTMLDNVARYLRPGGVFIGTIPDSAELRGRLHDSGASAKDRSFGNRYYKVVFDQIETFPPFGNRYTFFLEDAVENVPEYVVKFDVFEDLAREVGLRCIYRKNFAEIYHDESRHPEFGRLLERMKVCNRDGSLVLDEDMWQAATIYLGFAFEKM